MRKRGKRHLGHWLPLLLHFFRHSWEDDLRQTRRWHYQHCRWCPEVRVRKRETFYRGRED